MDSDIIFSGAFGSETKEIKLAMYWVNTWYVFVDNYLVSFLVKRDGQWLMTDQGRETMFTGADAMVLGEIVESAAT